MSTAALCPKHRVIALLLSSTIATALPDYESLTASLQTTSTHVPHALCAEVPCSSGLDVLTAATMLYGHCPADSLPKPHAPPVNAAAGACTGIQGSVINLVNMAALLINEALQ